MHDPDQSASSSLLPGIEHMNSLLATATQPAQGDPPDAAPLLATPEFDLGDPALYLNRELTWLEFNRRVLNEADDERTPLLERVKFLAIVCSNMDEFFMKRIGGLKQQIGAGVTSLTVDGRTPLQQVRESKAIIRRLQDEQKRIYDRVMSLLEAQGCHLSHYQALPSEDQAQLREHFRKNIFPMLTPLAMDPAHPFPFISNLTLNLLVTLRFPGGDELYRARIKVPVHSEVSSRFVRVDKSYTFVTLDDIVANNLDMLFPGMKIDSCELFRVTRNANVEKDEDVAIDLLEMIESELKERQVAPVVRLEVVPVADFTLQESPDADEQRRNTLRHRHRFRIGQRFRRVLQTDRKRVTGKFGSRWQIPLLHQEDLKPAESRRICTLPAARCNIARE
jgi:polyphosphate kinase